MRYWLRYCMFAALSLGSLSACRSAAEEVQPVVLEGAWRLTASGGGITGIVEKMPVGTDNQLVFGPDSLYSRVENGVLRERNVYRLRPDPAAPDQRRLQLNTTNTPTDKAVFYTYHLTYLTATELHFMTPGGCPLIFEYTRVSPSAR